MNVKKNQTQPAQEKSKCVFWRMVKDRTNVGYLLRIEMEFSTLGVETCQIEYWNNYWWLYIHDSEGSHAISFDYFYENEKGEKPKDKWVREVVLHQPGYFLHVFDEFNEKVVSKYIDKIKSHTLTKEEFRDIVSAFVDYIDDKSENKYHDMFTELKEEITVNYRYLESVTDDCTYW